MSRNIPRSAVLCIASLALARCAPPPPSPATPPIEIGDAAAIAALSSGRGATVVNLFATW